MFNIVTRKTRVKLKIRGPTVIDSGNLKGKVWLSTGQTKHYCLVLNVIRSKHCHPLVQARSTLQGQK